MWRASARVNREVNVKGEVVVFVAHESVCLMFMQEGATQGRDCLSQTRRGARPPSRVNSSPANEICGSDCSVCK